MKRIILAGMLLSFSLSNSLAAEQPQPAQQPQLTHEEIKVMVDAMLEEVIMQRNISQARSTSLAGENALLRLKSKPEVKQDVSSLPTIQDLTKEPKK